MTAFAPSPQIIPKSSKRVKIIKYLQITLLEDHYAYYVK